VGREKERERTARQVAAGDLVLGKNEGHRRLNPPKKAQCVLSFGRKGKENRKKKNAMKSIAKIRIAFCKKIAKEGEGKWRDCHPVAPQKKEEIESP